MAKVFGDKVTENAIKAGFTNPEILALYLRNMSAKEGSAFLNSRLKYFGKKRDFNRFKSELNNLLFNLYESNSGFLWKDLWDQFPFISRNHKQILFKMGVYDPRVLFDPGKKLDQYLKEFRDLLGSHYPENLIKQYIFVCSNICLQEEKITKKELQMASSLVDWNFNELSKFQKNNPGEFYGKYPNFKGNGIYLEKPEAGQTVPGCLATLTCQINPIKYRLDYYTRESLGSIVSEMTNIWMYFAEYLADKRLKESKFYIHVLFGVVIQKGEATTPSFIEVPIVVDFYKQNLNTSPKLSNFKVLSKHEAMAFIHSESEKTKCHPFYHSERTPGRRMISISDMEKQLPKLFDHITSFDYPTYVALLAISCRIDLPPNDWQSFSEMEVAKLDLLIKKYAWFSISNENNENPLLFKQTETFNQCNSMFQLPLLSEKEKLEIKSSIFKALNIQDTE